MVNKLLEKLKEFFNKIKGKKTLLLKEIDIKEENSEEDRKKQFKENINVGEQQTLLNIQEKYEKEKKYEEKLSTSQITSLIQLYKKQIEDLNIEISIKKAKINIT